MPVPIVAPYYQDLLGLPWKEGSSDPSAGLDCTGVGAVLFKRAGIWRAEIELQDPRELGGGRWEQVEGGVRSCRPLDLILQSSARSKHGSHVWTTLIGGWGGSAISSTIDRGVHVWRVALIPEVVGVYRFIG